MVTAGETEDYVCLESSNLRLDFDGLYRNVADPWGSLADSCGSYRAKCEHLSSSIVAEGVQTYAEVGCGTGHWLRRLRAAVAHTNCIVEGYDASPVAVDLGGGEGRGSGCSVHDIIQGPLGAAFDVVCLDGLLSYVMHDIEAVLEHALQSAPRCWIAEFFWKDKFKQPFGREVFFGQEGLVGLIESLGYIVERSDTYELEDDPVFCLGLLSLRKPVTIYTDGVWDLLHHGHLQLLRQARAAGDRLVVGVMSDELMEREKRKPVMHHDERAAALRHVKWVDEVVERAPDPVDIDDAFLRQHRISKVVHAFPPSEEYKIETEYAHLSARGLFARLKRTEGISTSDIIARIAPERAEHEERAAGAAPSGECVGWTKDDIERFVDTTEYATKSYAKKYPLVFTRAEREFVYTSDGTAYLDAVNGFGVHALGHNAPALRRAATAYADRSPLSQSLDFVTPEHIGFVEAVQSILSPQTRNYKFCFSGPSGSDAVETGLAIARKHYQKRQGIFAFRGAFHGCTHLAGTCTGNPDRAGDYCAAPNVMHFPAPCASSAACPFGVGGAESERLCLCVLQGAMEDAKSGCALPAAIILEPVQSDGGIIPMSATFAQGVEKLCRKHSVLLICDEVQTGLGKTGYWFGFERLGVVPDIMCCSKAFGGGQPLAMCLYHPALEGVPHRGTFRGNQLAFVLGRAVIEEVLSQDLLSHVRSLERSLRACAPRVEALKGVVEFRVVGALLGVELESTEVCSAAFEELLRHRILCKQGGRGNKTLIFWLALNASMETCTSLSEGIYTALKQILPAL